MTRTRSIVCQIGVFAVAALGPAVGLGGVDAQAPGRERTGATRPVSPGAPVTMAPTTTAPLQEYRIGPEDVLDITVWKNPELTRTVSVRPDGRISVPLLNDIEAANLTPMELRDILAKGYAEFVNAAEVSVIVREIHSFKVTVMGMVRTPGRFELRSQATALDALAMAGGFSEFAKRDRIVVFRSNGRGGMQRFGLNYAGILDGSTEENFVLRPGDIIAVP
jgi:polysaccharide export outer membrane protein